MASAPCLAWTDDGPPESELRLRGDARAANRGLTAAIWPKDKPTSRTASRLWVVDRPNAWFNAYKTLVWCTERSAIVIAFWIAFSAVTLIFGRLVRAAWSPLPLGDSSTPPAMITIAGRSKSARQ